MSLQFSKLGPLCRKIGSGVTPRGGSSVYVSDGTALIRSQNVYNSAFEYSGLAFVTDAIAEKMSGVAVHEKDVLLNITGDSVARCTMVPSEVLPARVNQHVAIIRPDPNKLDPKFLASYLVSPRMQAQMLSWAGSGGTRKALTKGMLEDFEVPVPDIETQRRIGSVLGAYDDLIENNRRRITLLEGAARLLFREWFVHLRFPGHEHAKQSDVVPNGWTSCTASEAIFINPKTAWDRENEIRMVPMASLSEVGLSIDTAGFEWRKKPTSVRFQNGDTLMARITPCLENGKTGFVNFLYGEEVACGSTEFIVLREKKVSRYFIYLLAREESFRSNAVKSMVGSSGRQRVQPSCFDKYKVLVPPTAIAAEFDDLVRPIFEQVAKLQTQVRQSAKARDLLLPRLMDGRIEV